MEQFPGERLQLTLDPADATALMNCIGIGTIGLLAAYGNPAPAEVISRLDDNVLLMRPLVPDALDRLVRVQQHLVDWLESLKHSQSEEHV